MGLAFFQRIADKRQRYLRHFTALRRYSSFRKLLNLLRVEWERLLGREKVKGLPYIVVLDPTNVCNLKCPVCPTTKGTLAQPSGRIGVDAYRRFVDDISPHAYRLILYNWGEPFMHRQIIDLIRYAHHTRVSTMISTNLNILPREGAEALVESGLDDLVVSCDGLLQESYKRYRVGGHLDKVKKNMEAIRVAKRRLRRSNPHVEFQFLVFQHNEHEVELVEDFAHRLGADSVRVVRPAVDLDSEDIRPAENPDWVRAEILEQLKLGESVHETTNSMPLATAHLENHPEGPASPDTVPTHAALLDAIDCYWPWRVLTSNWNGDIDPCCYHNQLGSFGNFFEQPLIELINNEKFRYARRRIAGRASGDGFDDVICKNCAGYTV